MGVITSADEARDELKERLINISKEVLATQRIAEKVIAQDTWGGDSWNPTYRGIIIQTIDELSKMRMMLFKLRENL